jgi:hypothetical protein
MGARVLAVRAEDYVREVGEQPFIALPGEEIERLYGTLEVLRLENADPAYLPLATFTAIHYNYSWLTVLREQRSLGIGAAIQPEREAPPLPFLDHAFEQFARREVGSAIVLDDSWQWRMAGLINDGRQLSLVYIVRLRQRELEPRALDRASIRFSGNGELHFARAEFEPWSQLLIENLHAL